MNPTTIPEDVLLKSVDHVAGKLASRLAFGYYEADDIRQDIFLLALRAVETFNPEHARGADLFAQFKNHLFIHVKNKLGHAYRDKFHRSDPPCKTCGRGTACGDTYCRPYLEWRARNVAKASLFSAARGSGDGSPTSGAPAPAAPEPAREGEDPADRELVERVREQLPAHLRADFLRLSAGARFPKGRRAVLLKELRKIIAEAGHGQED